MTAAAARACEVMTIRHQTHSVCREGMVWPCRRLDGKPAQMIDRRDAIVEELSDADLHIIAWGGLSVPQKTKVLLIPPSPKVKS